VLVEKLQIPAPLNFFYPIPSLFASFVLTSIIYCFCFCFLNLVAGMFTVAV